MHIDELEKFQCFLETEVMFTFSKPILMQRGEAVIWHDHLVLHGRNSYDANILGDRHLMKTQLFWNEESVC